MTTHTHSDLSGDEIPNYTGPVRFVWVGSDYEIDLTAPEAVRFSEALSGLLDAIAAEEKAGELFSPFLAAARYAEPFIIVAAGAERPDRNAEPKKDAPAKPKRVRKASPKKATTPRKAAPRAIKPHVIPGASAGDFFESAGLSTEPPASNGNGKTAHKPADVRKWANDHGYNLQERGRIPAATTAAYEAAMAG